MLVALAQLLQQSVTGRVLAPEDPEWASYTSGFNLAVTQRPELVVAVTSTDDVAHAVRFATDNGLPVAVQATGHGAAVPADGGMLIDTRAMTGATIDPARRVATTAAGVRWQQVIDAAAPHGLAPLNGSSVTVGVVGYTLGGGLGPMSRTFGFASDHVRRLQLVTSDGVVREVTAESEPELFWALRGGKCQLGVVTEIEFDLMPVAQYYGGGLFFAGEDAAAVLHTWRDWAGELPDEASTSVALLRLPDLPEVPEPLRGRLTAHVRYLYVGDPDEGSRHLAPMRAAAAPVLDAVAVTPYSAVASVHGDPTHPMPVWDTCCLLRELPAAAIDALLEVAGPGADVPLIVTELRLMGGAAGNPPPVADAVGGRDAAFSFYTVGPLPPPLAEVTPAAARAVLGALAPWDTGRTLINFHGSDVDRPVNTWDAGTAARLAALHQRHDPQRTFRFSHPHARPV